MSKPVTASTVALALNKEPNPFTFEERSTKGIIGQSSSTNSGGLVHTTGLGNLRENLHEEGISKRATELTANSRWQGSSSSVMSPLGKIVIAGVLDEKYLPLDHL